MSQSIDFALPASPLQVTFDGPQLTSDGGLCWLSAADAALGLCAALAAQLPDWRTGPVKHSLEQLIRQRVFQIACGYEDQDDADTLRADPLLKLVCGRLPTGDPDLASLPTLTPAQIRTAFGTLEADLTGSERDPGERYSPDQFGTLLRLLQVFNPFYDPNANNTSSGPDGPPGVVRYECLVTISTVPRHDTLLDARQPIATFAALPATFRCTRTNA